MSPIKDAKLYQLDFEINLIRVIKTVGFKDIRDLYLKVYDELASREESEAGSAIRGKDPLSLKNLRHLFARQIAKEVSKVEIREGQIVLELMDKDLLGYAGVPKTGAPQTVDIMVYYLEGVQGEHAFLTLGQYRRGRSLGSGRGNFGGRLGHGFMMTRANYEKENWEEITGVSFAQVRHPISDQSAFKGFEDLPSKIPFDKYISLALKQTNQTFGA